MPKSELDIIKKKIIKVLKEQGPAHTFFLAEKVGCPNNTKPYRRKVNEAIEALFKEQIIKIESISAWTPEEMITVNIIALKED